MRKIKMLLLISLLSLYLFTGCEKQKPVIDLESIDISEIEKIELFGTTGGKDGHFSCDLSEDERQDFVELLNRVELGNEVNENDAMADGGVTYYHIYFSNGDKITISPGPVFKVQDTYYKFNNFDELWDQFVMFNSIG